MWVHREGFLEVVLSSLEGSSQIRREFQAKGTDCTGKGPEACSINCNGFITVASLVAENRL